MNNNNNSNRNNNNNNRRRGRGNRPQGGGGNQNRIDSRARGNAPQMLDKYRKLAQDAQHNGDRVQAEYYLQFADHYFRVIADSRVRPDEARGARNERDFSTEEDGDEDDFDSSRNARDDRPQDRPREDRPRDDRPREDRPREDRPREDRPREDRPREDRQREGRGNNGDRNRSPQRQPARRAEARDEGDPSSEREGENEAAFEPAENPFVRANGTRDNRRTRAPRGNADESDEMTSDAGEIDAAALPPSFSANANANTDVEAEAEAEPATRKLPPRRRRKPADEPGDGDNLTAVG